MKAKLILIVDDDPDQIVILAAMLRGAGYDVVSSMAAEIALRKAAARKPDLILTDLSMPQTSGVQLTERLRADPAFARVPIVAVTAHVWDGIAQAAGTAGVDGFISKPYTRAHLLAEVEKHLDRP